MAKESTYAGKLGELQRFTAALTANKAELSHLEGTITRLESLLSQAQQAAAQQKALTASKQETSKQLKVALVEGKRLMTGLATLLKEFYGLRSEKIAEFGLQPFRGRKLRKETPETPELPEGPEVKSGQTGALDS
jgi:UDP-N-acetylmuramyl tripeptide synthase